MSVFCQPVRKTLLLMSASPLLLVLAAGPDLASAAGPSSALVAHRAVYDLTLASSTGDKAPAAATGRIAFDFTGSPCEGWVMNFRQLTTLQPSEGEQRTSDMHSSTFEDGNAKSFRFKTETLIDGRPNDVTDGAAKKSGDGALSLNLTRPVRAKLDLDQDVVFPTEQISRILEAAHAGKTTAEMKVFDGSDDGQKVYNTLSIIGREVAKPPTDSAAKSSALAGISRWPVSVSYFDVKKSDGTPDYVLSFELYDNGVSGALRLDYGDFVLKGELTNYTPLPQKECSR